LSDKHDDALSAEEQLANAIRVLMRELTVRSQDKNGDGRLELSGTELHLMGRILAQPGLMSKRVATYLGLTATTVQSVIERLEKRKLLTREPHPDDKRAVALKLTKTGEDTIRKIHERDVSNSALMLSALPADKRQQFVDSLAIIAEKVGASD